MRRLLSCLSDLGVRDEFTVPTDNCADAMHAAEMRLDYIMASHSFAQFLQGEKFHASALITPQTKLISDHYPVRLGRHTHIAEGPEFTSTTTRPALDANAARDEL